MLLGGLLSGGLVSGCSVHVYQPLAGLQNPVVVDHQAPNLRDVNLTLRCYPGDVVNTRQAANLCENVAILFENQGAEVSVASSFQLDAEEEEAPEEEGEPKADLVVELRSRQLNASNDPLLWTANLITLTIIPAITEFSFAQDVTVRDESGFLLASATLQGRMIRYWGVGYWAVNAALNLTREEEDKIEEDTAKQDLSEDLYKQLSQVVYNAKVQWQVQQEAAE